MQLSTGRAASCPGGGQLQGDFLSRAQILIAAVASPGLARANSFSPVSYVTNVGYGLPSSSNINEIRLTLASLSDKLILIAPDPLVLA